MRTYLKKIMATCLAVVIMLISIMPVYAETRNLSVDISAREYSDDDFVGIEVSPRGQLISSATLELSDEGYRSVGIYSRLLCHEEVRKINVAIMLQKLEGGSWKTVNRKDVEWLKEDYPDDDMSMAIVTYKLRGLDAGDYRLKGNYSVFEMGGSLQEFKAVTTGVLEVR